MGGGSIPASTARTSEGETLVNTLTTVLDTVKIRFQIAPGIDANLGIASADFRILVAGTEISSGQTNADGEVEVPLQPLLTGPVTVRIFESDFNITLHGGLQAVTTRAGQQKRFDILGYMTGYQRTLVGNAAPDDGTDGSKTQQSIMNLQTDASLTIDGEVGNNTRTQLTTRAGE